MESLKPQFQEKIGTTIPNILWSRVLATHDKDKRGRGYFLKPKPIWDLSPQATMSNSTKASMRLNISMYHVYLNSSLLEITIPSYPWYLPPYAIMRPTISSYYGNYPLNLTWYANLKLSCLNLISQSLLYMKWSYDPSSS